MSHDFEERPLMSSTTALSPERILSLLDRLDPPLDEPCTVSGCVHLSHTLHDMLEGRVAA